MDRSVTSVFANQEIGPHSDGIRDCRRTYNFYSFERLKPTENYRIIFRVEGENVYDVDYLDYH